jgi:hypothetical protein
VRVWDVRKFDVKLGVFVLFRSALSAARTAVSIFFDMDFVTMSRKIGFE